MPPLFTGVGAWRKPMEGQLYEVCSFGISRSALTLPSSSKHHQEETLLRS